MRPFDDCLGQLDGDPKLAEGLVRRAVRRAQRMVDALNAVIDDGIEAARHDYAKPRDTLKREGAIAGFEECRGKEPAQIASLLVEANQRSHRAMHEDDPRYWYWRCRALEIGWVANVLSSILVAQGTLPIGDMTARGRLKAAEIIGVGERSHD